MLIIQEINDWCPRVSVVNIVTKAGSINDRKTDCERSEQTKGHLNFIHTFEEFFFQLSLRDLNFHSLFYLFLVSALVVGVVLDCGRKKRVDESGLSKPRFTSNLICS